jgi:hypothetical protein
VAAREVEVASFMPIGSKIAGPPGCGGERAELASGDLAFRLREIIVERVSLYFRELAVNRCDQGIALLNRGIRADGEQAFSTGTSPRKGRNFQC